MAFQTQCCVLLTILITITGVQRAKVSVTPGYRGWTVPYIRACNDTAGVPVPSQNGDAVAASSSCSPCSTPKNLPRQCIYEVLARDPNTGDICPYCINLCRSTIKTIKTSVIPRVKGTGKTAHGNVPPKTKSVVSTRITKKSKKERKATKTKSKSKRRSSRRNKSKQSSRRSKSKSGKVTSNLRASNKKNKIQNKAASRRQSLLKKYKRRSKSPSVRLSYGQSTPDKVSPQVRSSKGKTSRDGVSHLKTSQVNSRRSRVRSTDLQSTDSFAKSWSPPRDSSYLSSSKYRSNKRNRVRNSGRSLNREPSLSGQNNYKANHDRGYTVNNGARNGNYDNGYDNSYDSRENSRDDDRSDDYSNGNDDRSAQGHIGGWDDSYNGNDRSRSNENDSHSDSFENVPRTGNTMAKTSMHGGSSSAENNNRSPVRNSRWSGSDQSSSESGSNSSEDDR